MWLLFLHQALPCIGNPFSALHVMMSITIELRCELGDRAIVETASGRHNQSGTSQSQFRSTLSLDIEKSCIKLFFFIPLFTESKSEVLGRLASLESLICNMALASILAQGFALRQAPSLGGVWLKAGLTYKSPQRSRGSRCCPLPPCRDSQGCSPQSWAFLLLVHDSCLADALNWSAQ